MHRYLRPGKLLASALLTLSLSACNGGSGGGTTPPTPFSAIYVWDDVNSTLLAWDGPQVLEGDVAPDRTITPDPTVVSNLANGLEYDSRSQSFLVGASRVSAIYIFDEALSAAGAVAPSRTITGANTQLSLSNSYDMAIDETRDLLYINGGSVLVFDNISSADGDVAPARVISNAAFDTDQRLALDSANDRLFIADYGATAVLVYDNASSVNGDMAPSRSFVLASSPWGIALDTERDILYINSYLNSTISIFDNASTIDAGATPDRTISGTTILQGSDMSIDMVTDTLYVTTGTGAQVMAWDNASTVDGAVAPTRVIAGANTTLARPVDVVGIH